MLEREERIINNYNDNNNNLSVYINMCAFMCMCLCVCVCVICVYVCETFFFIQSTSDFMLIYTIGVSRLFLF